jgi:hypothetical protein
MSNALHHSRLAAPPPCIHPNTSINSGRLKGLCGTGVGDWVLVHAAAGTGQLLTQILSRHLGARVIGTTSTADKAQLAKSCGAQEVGWGVWGCGGGCELGFEDQGLMGCDNAGALRLWPGEFQAVCWYGQRVSYIQTYLSNAARGASQANPSGGMSCAG